MSYGPIYEFPQRCSSEPSTPTPVRKFKKAKPAVSDAFPPTSRTSSPRISLSSLFGFAKSPRRRLRFSRSASPEPTSEEPLHAWRDQEFNFGLHSPGEISELESLPDLTEDTLLSPATSSTLSPLSRKSTCFEYFDLPLGNKTLLSATKVSSTPTKKSEHKEVTQHPCAPRPASILEIPELVHKIIEYADHQNTIIPREKPPIRRKPLSFRHAMLIYGNEEAARRAMSADASNETTNFEQKGGVLHSCLLVNKLFNRIAKEIIAKRVFFTDESTFCKFVEQRKTQNDNYEILHPKMLVLNQLFHLRQSQLDSIVDTMDYSSLEWLEFFMCPKICPSPGFLGPSLKTLIVTGSRAIDDNFLVQVAQKCPNLEVLDVRACDNITDYGVHAIGTSCTKLTLINLGRKKKGHLITDQSVSALACNNRQLQTAGLAGCYITDHTIWQLALKCGARLQRLSLNNCPYVTDQSIPLAMQHNLFQVLNVLELRFVTNITNFKPIITYKRRQAARGIYVLVETCEELLLRMRQQEARMNNIISQQVVRDIVEWVNEKDEDDASYARFLSERGLASS